MNKLFEKHSDTLNKALEAIKNREYWSPYSEMPSPRVYGENASAEGKIAFDELLGKEFNLDQPGKQGVVGEEVSPYGIKMDIKYPVCDYQTLIESGEKAMELWQQAGVDNRAGVCLEILHRINQQSFLFANAVMMTSGQGYMMSFQAGGPHAQDRGLEAVTSAYREMSFIAKESTWEKPQGKNPALKMKKHFEVVGQGVAVVVGCGTFPTWNTYPGLFAALATGNAVIIKPHPNAVLPAAITVKIIRETLAEVGLDPNLVSLCISDKREVTTKLVTHPQVKSVDFTGSNVFGQWLVENCRQARVYTELAGVNNIVIESTNSYKLMLRNLAFTVSLYSGQMCTTSQAIIVPGSGIDTDEGHKSYDDVCNDLSGSVGRFLSKPEVAFAVLGAIQSDETANRIDEANKGNYGKVVLASQKMVNPDFPKANVSTPALIACDDADEKSYMEERFGPITFIVKTSDSKSAIALSEKITKNNGALTVSIYSNKDEVIDAMVKSTIRSKVALSINLCGGVFVNQSSAFSDFHGTGGNPAANASYTDAAFVANRFVVVQRRYHVD